MGNPGNMWGPRQPVVVSSEWNRVDVKMELMTAEAAKGAVVTGLVYCGSRRTVHMAVGGGGASVARANPVNAAPLGAIAGVPRAGQLGRGGRVTGSGLGRTMAGGCFRCGLVGHWKNECPRVGGVDNRSCFTCGARGHVSRDCARRVAATGAPDRVQKTMEEIEKSVGPSGARS